MNTSLIITAQALNFINKISIETVVAMITASTRSINTIIGTIVSNNNINFIKQDLVDLDLDFLVSVISQLVKEQENDNPRESVKYSLISLNNILLEINKELLIMKESVDYHNKKFFSSWRSLDCSININLLKQHKIILNSRYKILSNLLQIYKK